MGVVKPGWGRVRSEEICPVWSLFVYSKTSRWIADWLLPNTPLLPASHRRDPIPVVTKGRLCTRRNSCLPTRTSKVTLHSPPRDRSPTTKSRQAGVWEEGRVPPPKHPTPTPKGLNHPPNKHAPAHTQFSRDQDGNLLVLARRVRRPDPPRSPARAHEAGRWGAKGAAVPGSGRGAAGRGDAGVLELAKLARRRWPLACSPEPPRRSEVSPARSPPPGEDVPL